MRSFSRKSDELNPQQEAFLQGVIEHLADGLIVINSQGEIVFFNPAAEKIFGYAQMEIQGRNISEFMPEPYAGEHNSYLENYLRSGKKQIIGKGREVIGKRKDGSIMPLYISVSEMCIDGENLFLGVIHDLTFQKNTEQQIRKSEERFRATFDQAAVGIVHVSIDGRFLRVNQRFCDIIGYSQQELRQLTVKDITYSEDWELDVYNIREVLEGRRSSFSLEKRYCRKDGSIVWANLTASLLRPTTGENAYFIGVLEDISQRRQTEKKLYINEERLKLASEASKDALWDWIVPENRSYWSPNYYRMLDYEPDEFPASAETFARLLHPDDRERVLARVAEAAQKDEVYQEEFRLQSKSGGWRWIFSRGRVVEWTQDSQAFRMIGTHIDITERKQAEQKLKDYGDRLEELVEQRTQQLKESEERFRTLVDSMDDVIFTLDCEQRHSGVFGHWIESQGVSPEFFLGKTSREILGPEAALVHEKANREALQGRNIVYEWSIPQPDGTMLHFQTSLSPIWNDAGEVSGLVGVGRDITAHKYASEALQKAKEEAEKANRAKSEFLANMSHELRTPLNAILGFAQLMQRDRSIPSSQQENLRIISRSGEHLLQLINDVLELSKIEVGRNTLHLVNFDLYVLLKELAEMFSFRAQDKGIDIYFDIAPELPQYIRSDERKLRQILLNLLSNAVRFTEKGEVRLTVSNRQQADCQPPTAHCLQFTVTDTGPGIPEEEQDLLFEAFSQTSSGRKSGTGSGLGLALSRQFAELLGGNIRIETREAQGSSFILCLKVELIEAEALQSYVPERTVIGLEAGHAEFRILIVDDNLESRAILRQLLHSIGLLQIKEARNGQEGLEQFRLWHPHFIWMDMRMPFMDGYETTRRIRAIEHHAQTAALKTHVPIVAFTANAFEEQRAVVLEAGCDDLLSKPFQEDEIFSLLKKFLGLRYRYEDASVSPQDPPADLKCSASSELASGAFITVPRELLSQLEVAAERSNMSDIESLLETLHSHNSELALTLRRFADEFAYDKILTLLRECK